MQLLRDSGIDGIDFKIAASFTSQIGLARHKIFKAKIVMSSR